MAGGKARKKSTGEKEQSEHTPNRKSPPKGSNFSPRLIAAASVMLLGVILRLAPWKTELQVPRDGAGCWPLREGDENSSWLLSGPRRLHLEHLPEIARPYVCYNGRVSSEIKANVLEDSAVVIVENFLTEAEIQHFRTETRKHAKPTAQRGYQVAFAAGDQYEDGMLGQDPARTVVMKGDTFLKAVEERIGAVTGVPVSGDESHLQLSLDTFGSSNAMPNFHHDKNHGLVRRVTALIYLTTPEDGGETIFPALPFTPGGPSARSPEMVTIVREFQKIVATQITANKQLTPESPWPDVQVTEGSALHKKLAKLCPAKGEAPGNAMRSLAVQPVPGRAVFFWHEVVNGSEPLLDTFHAGCPVRSGEKLSLQKFKNFAPGTPGCEASRWCKHFF